MKSFTLWFKSVSGSVGKSITKGPRIWLKKCYSTLWFLDDTRHKRCSPWTLPSPLIHLAILVFFPITIIGKSLPWLTALTSSYEDTGSELEERLYFWTWENNISQTLVINTPLSGFRAHLCTINTIVYLIFFLKLMHKVVKYEQETS